MGIGWITVAASLYMTKRFRHPDIGVGTGVAVIILGVCLLPGSSSAISALALLACCLPAGLFIVVLLVTGVFVASRRRAHRHEA